MYFNKSYRIKKKLINDHICLTRKFILFFFLKKKHCSRDRNQLIIFNRISSIRFFYRSKQVSNFNKNDQYLAGFGLFSFDFQFCYFKIFRIDSYPYTVDQTGQNEMIFLLRSAMGKILPLKKEGLKKKITKFLVVPYDLPILSRDKHKQSFFRTKIFS